MGPPRQKSAPQRNSSWVHLQLSPHTSVYVLELVTILRVVDRVCDEGYRYHLTSYAVLHPLTARTHQHPRSLDLVTTSVFHHHCFRLPLDFTPQFSLNDFYLASPFQEHRMSLFIRNPFHLHKTHSTTFLNVRILHAPFNPVCKS